jgi:hypothetical protein
LRSLWTARSGDKEAGIPGSGRVNPATIRCPEPYGSRRCRVNHERLRELGKGILCQEEVEDKGGLDNYLRCKLGCSVPVTYNFSQRKLY